jgi:hypothetical protein
LVAFVPKILIDASVRCSADFVLPIIALVESWLVPSLCVIIRTYFSIA